MALARRRAVSEFCRSQAAVEKRIVPAYTSVPKLLINPVALAKTVFRVSGRNRMDETRNEAR
jgi:hypothetical protein